MRFQGMTLMVGAVLVAAAAHAQQVEQTATPTVIRSETKLVLVDSVVTDKKQNYITDLRQKDFKVWEDNKEQTIKSFSFEADPASPLSNQKHYLVLFFDNASANPGEQMQARDAAAKFIDNNTGPTKFIAIANFTGSLKISQNFTNDADRLKAVVKGVKNSAVTTDDGSAAASPGLPTLSAASEFGVRSVLLALRSLAKGLETVPGRKTLVMLTSGFPLTTQVQAELTATIDACNHANVAVYPIDVRGLSSGVPGMDISRPSPIIREPMAAVRPSSPFGGLSSLFHQASFSNSFAPPEQASRGGATGGSTGTGGASTGSTGGSRGGTTGSTGSTGTGAGTGANTGAGVGSGSRVGSTGATPGGVTGRGLSGNPGNTGNSGNPAGRGNSPGGGIVNPALNNNRNLNNPLNNPRNIMPTMPTMGDMNQNALFMLAEGTGGFVIRNTNDLLGGMEKIGKEQNQYYILAYTPEESAEGTCHTIKVKVDRGGSTVRSRTGYCNVTAKDPLAGKPVETELESIAAGAATGTISSPLQLPFFYSAPNVARVNVAMEIATKTFKFEKVKGKQHAELNILGVASKKDGSVAAKFSDTMKFDFDDKKQIEEFAKNPLHYENQFEIASGEYNVKVVFSAGGENFGKIEKPLSIDAFDGKQFAISGLALAGKRQAVDEQSGIDAVLVQDRVPLVALTTQFIPAGQYRFKASEEPGLYLEIYDTLLLEEKPPQVGVNLKVVDRKTGEVKLDSKPFLVTSYIRKGSSVVPVGLKIPLAGIGPGAYRIEVVGLDSANNSKQRTADFDIE